jgi:hypothetical protein
VDEGKGDRQRDVGAEGLGRINKDRKLAKDSPTLSAKFAESMGHARAF